MSDEIPGLPDKNAEYFAQITFGRKAGEGETEDTVYLNFEYPNLPYSGMVGIQKLLAEGALQDLVLMGEAVSEMMGEPVQTMDEVREIVEAGKAKRGQGQGKGPVKK
jgi:hypothetical protein